MALRDNFMQPMNVAWSSDMDMQNKDKMDIDEVGGPQPVPDQSGLEPAQICLLSEEKNKPEILRLIEQYLAGHGYEEIAE
jgi:hypothetical protein